MRKFWISFICIFLVVAFSVPAFASTGGSSTLPVPFYQSGFPFDYISFNSGRHAGAVVDWSNNKWGDLSSNTTVAALNGSFRTQILAYDLDSNSYHGARVSCVFYLDDCLNYTIGANDVILWPGLSAYFDVNTADYIIETITVTGSYAGVAANGVGGNYEFVSRYVSNTYVVQGNTIDIAKTLGDCFLDGDYSKYARIKDLSITIQLSALVDEPVASRFVYTVSIADPARKVDEWFDYLDVPSATPTNYMDWSNWLIGVVDAFMNFQVAPGFTLNTVVWVILGLSVFFAVVTMFI